MKKCLKKIDAMLWWKDSDGIHEGSNPMMRGDCSGLTGNCTGLVGICSELWGDCSGLVGDCTGLKGDCTGLWGFCTGIVGDLRDCELTDKDRCNEINIESLVGQPGETR